ncbi:MAG: extracellular solute-binding protein, partial [Propionibacteriaceae bacterium]|nr:extracellular solute-binding protein [Propionibacteriaceae bacterium]
WAQGEKLVANQPAAAEAFAEMKKLIDANATQPNPGATNRQQAADLFNNGKLGMMLSHSGLLKVTRENYPQTKFDVAPIPSKGGDPVAFGVTDFIVAFDNKDANRKEATKQFLDLMYSDEFYEGWYQGTGLLPVTKSMIAKGQSEDKDNAKFYEALGYVKFLPVGNPQWDVLQKSLQGTAGTIANDTPETVLGKVQAQLDAQG